MAEVKKKSIGKSTGLYKRKNTPYWWVDVMKPDGSRIRQSTGTADLKLAKEYRDKLRAEMWQKEKLGELEPRTWDEAVERFLGEVVVECTPGTVITYRRMLAWWGEKMGFKKKKLHLITKGDISAGVYRRAAESSKSTANRYLTPVRAMLYRAVDPWGWLEKSPTRFKQFSEAKQARKRHLTAAEMQRLLQELPTHQKPIVEFALAMGFRAANVSKLEWSWIDMPNRVIRIPAEAFKNRESHVAPMNDTVTEIIRAQIGKHERYVFTYRGQPIKQLNTKAWKAALKRAGIEDYRWHDNRHTWATQLRLAGVDVADIQELGGWKSESMVKRYATVDLKHLAEKAARLDAVLRPTLTLVKSQVGT